MARADMAQQEEKMDHGGDIEWTEKQKKQKKSSG